MNKAYEGVKSFFSLVKFSHTIFAMPFALYGFALGIYDNNKVFNIRVLLLVIICMVLARNAAMAFNRFADKKIDRLNPRTAKREIPAGVISARAALIFVIINSVLFIIAAGFINRLTLFLSPVALLVVLGYSLTKRFTPYSHLFLGLALALAPVGAYISVTGSFEIVPVLIGLMVLTWVGGFDIIYAQQDAEFDSENKLHSIPSRFGNKSASVISSILHLLSILTAGIVGLITNAGIIYFAGTAIFAVLLLIEHIIARPGDSKSINMAFATLNSYAGLVFVLFAEADMYML
jgi:4-hydroxybenzoate polyprenyltransferase